MSRVSGAGKLSDRGFHFELKDKRMRLTGASWIEALGSAILFDDFEGDTLPADRWLATSTAGGGAGNVAFAIDATAGDPVAGHGGWISGTCSDNAAGAEELGGLAIWRPSRSGNGVLTFQTRITLPSVAAMNFSCGLTSARTYGNNTAMNLSGADTFVTTAANGACWMFDTRSTGDIFYGLSVDNNVDSNATEATAAKGPASTPAATTSYVLRIEIDEDGHSFFYVDDEFATNGRQAAAGTTLKATLLAPYFGVDNAGAGANKVLEVDYAFVACAR